MGEPAEEGCRHLRILEHARPFAEGEVAGDEDRGALIEPAGQMEQPLSAGLGERQIAQFVEDDEAEADERVGEPALAAGAGFALRILETYVPRNTGNGPGGDPHARVVQKQNEVGNRRGLWSGKLATLW